MNDVQASSSVDAETDQEFSTGILVFPPCTFPYPDIHKVYGYNHLARNVSEICSNIYIPRPSGYYCGVSALGSKYVDYTLKRVPLCDIITKSTIRPDKTCGDSGVPLCDIVTKSVNQVKTCGDSGVPLCDIVTKSVSQVKTCEDTNPRLRDIVSELTTETVVQEKTSGETETSYIYRIMTLNTRTNNDKICMHVYRNPTTQKDEFSLTKHLLPGNPTLLEFKVFLRRGYIQNVIVQTLNKNYKYKNYNRNCALLKHNYSNNICNEDKCGCNYCDYCLIFRKRAVIYSDSRKQICTFYKFKTLTKPVVGSSICLTPSIDTSIGNNNKSMASQTKPSIDISIGNNNKSLAKETKPSIDISIGNYSNNGLATEVKPNNEISIDNKNCSVTNITSGVDLPNSRVKLAAEVTLQFDLPNDSRYWITELLRRRLPMWRSIMPTHIPLEYPVKMKAFDLDDFCHTMPCDIDIVHHKLYSICREYQEINEINGSDLKRGTLCFNGTPYDAIDMVPEVEDRLITINTRTVLPPQLGLAEGAKRSVMYDHAMHMVITDQDTLWVGNLNYKPCVSPYRQFDRDETPLMRVEVEPGRYVWGAADVAVQMDHNDNEYFADKGGPDHFFKCLSCDVLETNMRRAQLLNKHDETPHIFMINEAKFNAKHNNTVISRAELTERKLDRFVHLWACDKEEFEQYPRTPETRHRHNWWKQIDKYLHGFDVEIVWPRKPDIPWNGNPININLHQQPNKINIHQQRFGHASKLIVKNPETFFRRQLVSFEIVNGGRTGAAFTLVDAVTFEVVGAVLIGLRGDSYVVHKKNEATRTRPSAGLYFTTKTYENTLEMLELFIDHMSEHHGDHENVKRDPRDFISYIGTACQYTRTSTPLAKFSDGIMTKECKFTHVYRPHDPYWYSRQLGTPRDKIIETSIPTKRYCVKRKLSFDEY